MGFADNIAATGAAQSRDMLYALLLEQRETNRLLRKLAGEQQPEYEVSDASRAAKKSRRDSSR